MAQYQTDFKTEKGVAVLQIYTDSPASAAGMKEGDVITAIDAMRSKYERSQEKTGQLQTWRQDYGNHRAQVRQI